MQQRLELGRRVMLLWRCTFTDDVLPNNSSLYELLSDLEAYYELPIPCGEDYLERYEHVRSLWLMRQRERLYVLFHFGEDAEHPVDEEG